MAFTGFLLGWNGFWIGVYRVFTGFTEMFNECSFSNLDSSRFSRFYWVLLGLTRFSQLTWCWLVPWKLQWMFSYFFSKTKLLSYYLLSLTWKRIGGFFFGSEEKMAVVPRVFLFFYWVLMVFSAVFTVDFYGVARFFGFFFLFFSFFLWLGCSSFSHWKAKLPKLPSPETWRSFVLVSFLFRSKLGKTR